MTPERQAEIIVGNCCMCRNPDITTPNPDMCRECKLRKSITETLSTLTRERDEAVKRAEAADTRLESIACDLRRSVVPNTIENMVKQLIGDRKQLLKERDELKAELAKIERSEEQLITERDDAEQALSQAYYLITGRSPEWSNHFGHKEAHDDISDAMNALKSEAKDLKARCEKAEKKYETECAGTMSRMSEIIGLRKDLDWMKTEWQRMRKTLNAIAWDGSDMTIDKARSLCVDTLAIGVKVANERAVDAADALTLPHVL